MLLNDIEWSTDQNNLTFTDALDLEQEGWRLPSVFELLNAAQQVHHDFELDLYWSSSPTTEGGSLIWCLNFSNLEFRHYFENNLRKVRLIRGGEPFYHDIAVKWEELDQFKQYGTLPDWHAPVE